MGLLTYPKKKVAGLPFVAGLLLPPPVAPEFSAIEKTVAPRVAKLLTAVVSSTDVP